MQLITGARSKGDNREQEVSRISRELKALAKRLNVPVIALSQLSRAVEARGGSKRPQLSDLRDSGSIEQDADVVIFPHRPEYYGQELMEDGSNAKGKAELIIAKNRNGRTGIVDCLFDPILGFRDADTGQFPTAEPKHQTITMPRNEPADNVPF
jgi:replicative DNA helicase